MRITGQKPVSGVQGKGGKKRTDASGSSFSPITSEESSSSASTSSAGGIQGMDALLALQEVGDEPDRRSKATLKGHDLLDALEQIKADLLAGVVSEETLTQLSEQVSEELDSGDPEVNQVLREIELRAKVELAKLGRFSS